MKQLVKKALYINIIRKRVCCQAVTGTNTVCILRFEISNCRCYICNMQYESAPEIKKTVDMLVEKLSFTHVKTKNVHCIRSFDAKTRAYARIWGMSKLFHEVAGLEPHYIIEVVSKKFDRLPPREKIKTLIHELMHIPKTFSGALLSHRGRYHSINDREVEKIIRGLER